MPYDRYPAIDETNNFAPAVRRALADSPEVAGEIAELGIEQPTVDPTARVYIKVASGNTRSALKIRNESNNYGLKIDQIGTDGVHDAVNIAALFAGAHTALGVVSGNTDFSTVKVTNNAPQVGGQIIAALGTNSARSAGIFGAENHGSGPAFVATMKPTSTGVAFQAAYDAGAYTFPIAWFAGHHTAGNLLYVENDGAHTTGAAARFVENNAASTVPMLFLANAGTGDSINAPSFTVMKDGRTKVKQIENLTSFNNSQVKTTDAGTLIDRNVNDASAVLRVQNVHATSTGDIFQAIKTGTVVQTRLDKDGVFITRAATPVDAQMSAGEVSMSFDPTNGAAQVVLKAKQTNGTVVSRNIDMRGHVLTAPGGTKFLIGVADDGALTTTSL